MINVPELRKQLEFITAHPERWNQETWLKKEPCGTVACLAGNTVLSKFGVERIDTWNLINVDGEEKTISELGQEILGLSIAEANVMFDADNTLWMLWKLANHLSNGEIEIPAGIDEPDEWDRELAEDKIQTLNYFATQRKLAQYPSF